MKESPRNYEKTAEQLRWLFQQYNDPSPHISKGDIYDWICIDIGRHWDRDWNPRTLEFIAERGQKPSAELAHLINRLYHRWKNRKPRNGRSIWIPGTPEEIAAIMQGLTPKERATTLLEKLSQMEKNHVL